MGLFKPAMSDKEEDVEEFEQVGSGASLTVPIMAGNIKKGSFVVIKNRPCKVVETSTSKTGKHGHAKVHMVGIDIFSGKKYEEICPSTHNMDVPNVERNEYVVIDVSDDGFVSLLKPDGSTKDDLKMPEGEEEKFREVFDSGSEILATVVSALGIEKIKTWKNQ